MFFVFINSLQVHYAFNHFIHFAYLKKSMIAIFHYLIIHELLHIEMIAGLNAGDEILQLNGKDARTLTFADMKVAFAQVSLSLTVNTLPPVDRRQLCFLPPRRSDAVDNLYTDIFSQSQGEGRPEIC